jgi:DNA mismatch endonuclease (patch repair protein)
MSTLARHGTRPEVLVRQELHRLGLRYRVQMKVPGNRRRTIDIAFTRARLAVYVDGCFWHGCPEHYVQPKSNTEWWKWKIERNQARDLDTVPAGDAGDAVVATYIARLDQLTTGQGQGQVSPGA